MISALLLWGVFLQVLFFVCFCFLIYIYIYIYIYSPILFTWLACYELYFLDKTFSSKLLVLFVNVLLECIQIFCCSKIPAINLRY